MDLISEVLQKGQMRSTRNRGACKIRGMNVDEARAACKDRSKRRSVSTYPYGKLRMYVNKEDSYCLFNIRKGSEAALATQRL